MNGLLTYITHADAVRRLRTCQVSPKFIAHIRRYGGNCKYMRCVQCPFFDENGICLPLKLGRDIADRHRLRLVNIAEHIQEHL